MSKLIGTGPNQVPSNADLGTAAFMDATDFLTSRGSTLSAINSVINKTVNSVFIYDTSNDSDAGAWRKRTSNTSWYNEPLNTLTRGSRREFPSVAVITAGSGVLTIYDGDDSHLPMWMVFENNTSTLFSMTATASLTGLAAVNGKIGTAGGFVRIFDFVKDFAELWDSAARYTFRRSTLIHRNGYDANGSTPLLPGDGIVSNTTYDIAMKVMPNAQIDPTTNLPRPTIAIATDSGYSLIQSDGETVYDGTCTQASHNKVQKVEFTSDNKLAYVGFDYNLQTRARFFRIDDLITSDTVITTDANTVGNSAEFYGLSTTFADATDQFKIPLRAYDYVFKGFIDEYENSLAIGQGKGLNIIDRNPNAAKSMGSYITKDVNTGYIPAVAMVATANETGEARSGSYASGKNIWKGANPPPVGSNAGTITLDASKYYRVSVTFYGDLDGYWPNNSPQNGVYISPASVQFTLNIDNGGTSSSPQTKTIYITGFETWTVHFWTGTGVTITNFEIVEIIPNYANTFPFPFEVTGTTVIEKKQVASGAELLSYSGFNSGSDLVKNDTHSNLNFGSTGTICIMGWQKISDISNYSYMASVYDQNNSSVFGLSINSSATGSPGTPYIYDNTNGQLAGTIRLDDDNWHFVAGIIDGGARKLYIDGVLNASSNSSNISLSTVNYTGLGHYYPGSGGGYQHLGEIALVRITKTIPSPEQIYKMYVEEKALFHTNAKASLYGNSSQVEALDYDDKNGNLHVGTSAGRSVFQGLQRIDNTTNSVGTALSAVDGFIVEE